MLVTAALLCASALGSPPPSADPSVDFAREVAPVLESRCVRCHGGDSTKGNLSLLSRESLAEGGDAGPAIVPGKPDESLLLEMITGEKPDMPRGAPPLAAAEIDAIRRWIAEGAPWPDGLALKPPAPATGPWWSLQPIDRPAVPTLRDPSWVRNPVDTFILARLEKNGLRPRPEADRRTLMRRLSYDLTGLPPAPAELADFLADNRPDAYERLVDRLLASPRYGERWARHWLDVVHYGDTHGYDKDKRRPNAWPYRDYVISALNADKPYGDFVREQVAGDVIAPGDPAATIATGFVAAGPWDLVGHVELREGTVDKLKTRVLDRDDMVSNTMSTFTSLTVHCARCHDHKFDPIPQADYYRLQAVFAGVDRGDRPYEAPEHAARVAALKARRQAAAEVLDSLQCKVDTIAGPRLAAFERSAVAIREQLGLPENQPTGVRPSPSNGYHSGIEPRADVTKWVQVDLGRSVAIEEIRLIPARPVDFPDTPGFGFPPRFKVEAFDDATIASPAVVLDKTDADTPNPGDSWWVLRPTALKARYVRITATSLWPRSNDFVFALGELQVLGEGRNLAAGAPVTALDTIEAGRWSTGFLVDGSDSRNRLDDPADDLRLRRLSDISYALRQAELNRSRLVACSVPVELLALRDRARANLAEAEANLAALPAAPQVYALQTHEPRPIHVLSRGDVEQPGLPVGPGALSCVRGLPAEFLPSTAGDPRAALADWIVQPDNPLTWRSIVNRVWHYHFGRGLVDTPNDFGRNGSLPSHPELLDRLAADFRDGGQSLKGLHRLIVTSATYRQASSHDESAARLDAENRLLWRQNRRRLEAEELRDGVLATSGTLDSRMGGPGFDLFRFKDDHSPVYDHDDPEWIDPPSGRRRAVYRFVVRSVPNPFLECLDGADPNANVPVRNETVTALQALALWNDPFIFAQARAFAARLERLESDPAHRIDRAFELALGRLPAPREREVLLACAARSGLAAACRVLFNTNEFAFVD